MQYEEFKKLTGLDVSYMNYTTDIEPRYMASKMDKQEWCKYYIRKSKEQPVGYLKRLAIDYMKEWLDNWKHADKYGTWQFVDEDQHFNLYYEDGTYMRVDIDWYEGQKVRLQGVKNIIWSHTEGEQDFYHDWIGTKEHYECFEEHYLLRGWNIGEWKPKYPLICETDEDLDEYYGKWEGKKKVS